MGLSMGKDFVEQGPNEQTVCSRCVRLGTPMDLGQAQQQKNEGH